MFQSFKLNFLSIIKVNGLRCLISKALGCFSKSTSESSSWILQSVSNKSCCTYCCSLQSAIFAFFLGNRFKGSFRCFSVEVNLIQGCKSGLAPLINLFLVPPGGLQIFSGRKCFSHTRVDLLILNPFLFSLRLIKLHQAFLSDCSWGKQKKLIFVGTLTWSLNL